VFQQSLLTSQSGNSILETFSEGAKRFGGLETVIKSTIGLVVTRPGNGVTLEGIEEEIERKWKKHNDSKDNLASRSSATATNGCNNKPNISSSSCGTATITNFNDITKPNLPGSSSTSSSGSESLLLSASASVDNYCEIRNSRKNQEAKVWDELWKMFRREPREVFLGDEASIKDIADFIRADFDRGIVAVSGKSDYDVGKNLKPYIEAPEDRRDGGHRYLADCLSVVLVIFNEGQEKLKQIRKEIKDEMVTRDIVHPSGTTASRSHSLILNNPNPKFNLATSASSSSKNMNINESDPHVNDCRPDNCSPNEALMKKLIRMGQELTDSQEATVAKCEKKVKESEGELAKSKRLQQDIPSKGDRTMIIAGTKATREKIFHRFINTKSFQKEVVREQASTIQRVKKVTNSTNTSSSSSSSNSMNPVQNLDLNQMGDPEAADDSNEVIADMHNVTLTTRKKINLQVNQERLSFEKNELFRQLDPDDRIATKCPTLVTTNSNIERKVLTNVVNVVVSEVQIKDQATVILTLRNKWSGVAVNNGVVDKDTLPRVVYEVKKPYRVINATRINNAGQKFQAAKNLLSKDQEELHIQKKKLDSLKQTISEATIAIEADHKSSPTPNQLDIQRKLYQQNAINNHLYTKPRSISTALVPAAASDSKSIFDKLNSEIQQIKQSEGTKLENLKKQETRISSLLLELKEIRMYLLNLAGFILNLGESERDACSINSLEELERAREMEKKQEFE